MLDKISSQTLFVLAGGLVMREVREGMNLAGAGQVVFTVSEPLVQACFHLRQTLGLGSRHQPGQVLLEKLFRLPIVGVAKDVLALASKRIVRSNQFQHRLPFRQGGYFVGAGHGCRRMGHQHDHCVCCRNSIADAVGI